MKSAKWIGFVLFLGAIGCGKSPPPTGPASEATTPEVEVEIPDTKKTTAIETEPRTLISFRVPAGLPSSIHQG